MKRSKHNLGNYKLLSCDQGQLVPIGLQEILPGDSFQHSTSALIRVSPLVTPVMHPVRARIHHFFVPHRLVWDNWEDFITGGRLGTSAPVPPYMNTINLEAVDMMAPGSLADHLGLPIVSGTVTFSENVSALPFRAYQLIYDEYYRDQNLTASLDISLASGDVTGAELAKITALRKRCWEKDYFTSALPFAQRGASVDIPLSDDTTAITRAYRAGNGGIPFTVAGDISHNNLSNLSSDAAGESGTVHIGAEGHGVNVNDLRRSIRLQD